MGFSEEEFLLSCCRSRVDYHHQAQVRLLAQRPLDWDRLWAIAHNHKVLPLVYTQLKRLGIESVPPAIDQMIQTEFQQNFQRNLVLTTELLNVADLLNHHDIPSLTFKGSTLAQGIYGNLSLRAFNDLDLLVPEAQVAQASQVLIQLGYIPQFALTAAQLARYISRRHGLAFWHEAKQIEIDLHWAILPRNFSFSSDQTLLWQQCEFIPFAHKTVRTLSKELLLVYLCAHGAKHNWDCLASLCDVAELIVRHPNLDWHQIHRLSRQLGTPTMLMLGLFLVQQLMGVEQPAIAEQFPPGMASLAEPVIRQFTGLPQAGGRSGSSSVYLNTLESRRDKLWFWCDRILTPTPLEWQVISLPAALTPLYYGIRPVRLLLKYWRQKTKRHQPLTQTTCFKVATTSTKSD